nr:hypothetical protein [Tanacetum cinerariifolium]GEZ58658.1 hypothetical protein [Tanacetum cinerariifolium]
KVRRTWVKYGVLPGFSGKPTHNLVSHSRYRSSMCNPDQGSWKEEVQNEAANDGYDMDEIIWFGLLLLVIVCNSSNSVTIARPKDLVLPMMWDDAVALII